MKLPCSLAWEDDFPPVYGNTSVSFLKHCPNFLDAKLGDMRAALKVVKNCLNPHTVSDIIQNYPDAVLLPVITNNKLPLALAKMVGMRTYTGVYELETLNRKSLTAMERLLHKPVFCGKIIKDKRYIIVDDIITQGGTVSALRKYVMNNGSSVDAIVTLSCSVGSNILVPSDDDVDKLINRFRLDRITEILRYYGIAHDLWELTRAQIKYLLLFKDLKCLINKIERAQIAINIYSTQYINQFNPSLKLYPKAQA